MTDRTCADCGADITGLHGNAKRCMECRFKVAPPSKRMCSNGCEKPAVAHGLCARCNVADVRRYGPRERLTPEERFWPKVDKAGPLPVKHPELGPCWIWLGKTTQQGYGLFSVDGDWVRASHFSWELVEDPLAEGVRLKFLCEVKACVRPDHMSPALPLDHPLRNERRDLVSLTPGSPAEDLAYWGALLDGEGYLGIRYVKDRPERPTGASRYIARLQLGMTDEALVRAFQTRFGTGKVCQHAATSRSGRPMYYTQVNGVPAAAIMTEVLPFLRLKRRQAELMIKLESEKRQPGLRTRCTGIYSYRRRDGRVVNRKRFATGQDHLDRWHGYFVEVRSLNRPGWDAEVPARPEQDDGAEVQDQVPVEPDLSLF